MSLSIVDMELSFCSYICEGFCKKRNVFLVQESGKRSKFK